MKRPRLFVSFSGGRTSAFMAYILWLAYRDDYEIIFIFANTGQEHEETLRFVKRCSDEWGIPIIWVEAVVDPRAKKATGFRIVTFETASRKGEPFRDVISKYGLPNRSYNHCNRELKLNPMYAYLKSIGWRKGSFKVAIGIRADEKDRASSSATKRGIFYPLIEWGILKADIIAFWKLQSFDLYLPEHLGNCVWCWKKTLRKHLTLAVDYADVFGFPRLMEILFSRAGHGGKERRLFRENRTVADIMALALKPFEKFVDGNHVFDPELDVGGACGDGCDIFADETA